MAKRAKQAIGVVIAIVITVAVIWLSLPIVLAPLLRTKLQALVSAHLNADLRIGSLRYEFPYGASAWDVHLVGKMDNIDIFSADRVEMSLVNLPTASGPLLIKTIVLQKPLVRVVRSAGGAIASRGLLRQIPGTQPTSKKLSDILQLRTLSIHDGQISWEDRSQPQAPAMVWQNLNADMHLAPQSGSLYGWNFAAASEPLARIASTGAIDVDQASLDVSKLAIDTKVSQGAPSSALPAQVQKFLRQIDAQGSANFQLSGHFPLKQWTASQVAASLELSGGHANMGGSEMSCDLKLTIDKQPDNPQLALDVKKLDAKTDAGVLSVQHLLAQLDSLSGAWRLSDIALALRANEHSGVSGITRLQGSISGSGEAIEQYDLTANLDDLSLNLRALEQPLQHINGTLHAAAGTLTADRISAVYGQDQFQLQTLQIPLDQMSEKIAFNNIAMSIDFHRPSPRYPGDLGKLIAQLNPSGSYDVHGNYAIVFHGPNESSLLLSGNDGDLLIDPKRIPITNLQANVLIGADAAQIRKFDGDLFGGTISATGSVALRTPNQFQANITLQNVDMQQASLVFASDAATQPQVAGHADANLTLSGTPDDMNSLSGHGEIRVSDGQVWRLPLFDGMASHTKIAREALTAGEAAAMFDIANSQIQISSAAINSPALGLQGNGTIGFDGQLDLSVIAAPLGDWEKDWKKMDIPIVGDLAGDLAGRLQKIVNSASELLYQFHVTGTISQPVVQTQASPMLSDAKAKIFGEMLRKKQSLLETLREFRDSKF